MSKHRRSRCIYCNRSGNDVAISLRGICEICADERVKANNAALANREGDAYAKWVVAQAEGAAKRIAALQAAQNTLTQ